MRLLKLVGDRWTISIQTPGVPADFSHIDAEEQCALLLMDIANVLRALNERIPDASFWSMVEQKIRGG
mgnify:CR=1 FL=1